VPYALSHMSGWTFLSNHSHVLLCIARNPDARMRDIATDVDITERAAHRLLADLVHEGYVSRELHGRRNRYKLNRGLSLRHPVTDGYSIDDLLTTFDAARHKNGAGPKTARQRRSRIKS
jgi:predicted ArsR family transcriptional regulator